jgi:hypothetical protein
LQGANNFGDLGARGLGRGLQSNTSLKELHIVSRTISISPVKCLLP